MAGRIVYVSWYSKTYITDRPDWLFAFGDNLQKTGRGGQAAVCRDLRNCVGIPTKAAPSREEEAYFTDEDFDTVQPEIDGAFDVLDTHLRFGGTVAWPESGIGTGLAELPTRAPKIHKYIQEKLSKLNEIVEG